MAASNQFLDLKNEATCSICLEYFKDPVIVNCGHNFCHSCITQYWHRSNENWLCPQCRHASEGNFLPNRQLGNIVEMLKQQELNLCEKHKQTQQLFCEEDMKLICLVCRESKEHKSHTVSPVDEAAEDYKVKLQNWLSPLKKELQTILESRLKKEGQCETTRIMLENEKQKIVAEIQRLRQLLQQKEQTLNQKMETHKKVTMAGNAAVSRLSNQSNYLNVLITEIEKKCKAPAWELLKDIRNTLSRCNVVKFQKLVPEMNYKDKRKPFHFEKIRKAEEKMKLFKAPSTLTLKSTPGRFTPSTGVGVFPRALGQAKVMVILDPDTAHCNLSLCLSRRRVKWTDMEQTWPDHAKRFNTYPCVLGSRGFTSGRYFWEVQLLQEGLEWHVGVAAESVNRKEKITWSPEGKVWVLRGAEGQYWALTSHDWTLLSLRENPTKLRVCLDCEVARLSVYNADTREHLYTFANAAFTERIFPFFALWNGAELNLV